jgi:hypothetical protein
LHPLDASKTAPLAPSRAKMAGDVVAEPDMTEQRKPRDPETGGLTAQSGDERIAETSSNHGPKAEKVETGQKEEEKKASKLKEVWGKLGLDMGTILMMFKYVWNVVIN